MKPASELVWYTRAEFLQLIEDRDADWQARVDAAEKAANDAFDRLAASAKREIDAARAEGKVQGLRMAAEMVRDDRGDIECVFDLLDLATALESESEQGIKVPFIAKTKAGT